MIKEVEKNICEEISILVKPFGYKLRKMSKSIPEVYKTTETGTCAISLDILSCSDKKHYRLNLTLKIRHDLIENIYSKYHPYRNPKDENSFVTLVKFYADLNMFKHSIVSNFLPSDTKQVLEEFKLAFKDDITPFFDKYSILSNFIENISDFNSTSRVAGGIGWDKVFCPLLSSTVIKKDFKKFEEYSKKWLEHCGKPLSLPSDILIAKNVIAGLKNEYFSDIN